MSDSTEAGRARMQIRWDGDKYKVSTPSYGGGTVVHADYHDKRVAELQKSLDDLFNWEDHRATIATVLGCDPHFGTIKTEVENLLASGAVFRKALEESRDDAEDDGGSRIWANHILKRAEESTRD